MATLEDLEISSLCSLDISSRVSLSPPAPPPYQPPSGVHSPPSEHHLGLQVPTFQFDSDDELESGTNSQVNAHTILDIHEPSKDRPKSVLSFLHRPISAISRAKSALSTRSTTIRNLPANMKQLIHKFANKARGRRNSSDDDLSSLSISDPEGSINSASIKKRLDSLAGSEYWDGESEQHQMKKWRLRCPKAVTNRLRGSRPTCNYYVDPHGGMFFYWMGLMCLAYVYNAVAIPLRASFDIYNSGGGLVAWLVFDYLFDLLYLLDIVAVQSHLSYTHNGVLESNLKLLVWRYIKNYSFWLDLVALFPLDLLYLVPVLRFNSLLRLPRLLKWRCVKIFLDRFESNTNFPHAFRVAKLVSYFLYTIHIYTCVFYFVSKKEGFGDTEWVYDGQGNSYLRCFYWATLSVATIHDLEERNPTNNVEYTLEMLGYLLGMFIIAIIIGEIRNIVEAANSQKLEVHQQWDRLKEYMHLWKIPKELQERVQSWYDYALTQQLLLDESRVLDTLPKKMKADLAIHVHLDTLSRVALFQEFEKTLLRELVLKLRPVLFVPGDYICKKGEIGKEMYIVNQGKVHVIGGAENSEVLAELGAGSVFGEISLLAVGGGNRRTAHVRSKGFSSLFVLSKKDLHETLEAYPDAQETLKKKARYLLRQDKKREHRRSQAQNCTPSANKLANTVRNSRAAKAAVTALTTAARAARARAAANRLEEEGWRSNKDGGRTEVHLATVHDDPSSTNDQMAFVKAAAGARMRAFTTKQPPSQITLASLTTSISAAATASTLGTEGSTSDIMASPSASGITYSSLWPSTRDVMMGSSPNLHQMDTPSSLTSFPSDMGFYTDDSSSC